MPAFRFSTDRRGLMKLAVAGLSARLGLRAAHAQTRYPDHPIRLIVPRSVSGSVDVIAREWSDKVKENSGSEFCRKPRWWRRPDRGRNRSPRAGRRLYAADRHHQRTRPYSSAGEAELRAVGRLLAYQHPIDLGSGFCGQSRRPGTRSQGIGRLRQGQSGKTNYGSAGRAACPTSPENCSSMRPVCPTLRISHTKAAPLRLRT